MLPQVRRATVEEVAQVHVLEDAENLVDFGTRAVGATAGVEN